MRDIWVQSKGHYYGPMVSHGPYGVVVRYFASFPDATFVTVKDGLSRMHETFRREDIDAAFLERVEKEKVDSLAKMRESVQGDGDITHGLPGHKPGTIARNEHLEALAAYTERYPEQPTDGISYQGGFSYKELVQLLGREPSTWEENP